MVNLPNPLRSLARLLAPQAQARQLDDELRSHIQHRVDDLVGSGIERAEAERRARVEFGGYQRYREECHEASGNGIGPTLRDLRYATRSLRKSPGFTAVSVATLALGIGGVTSVFSVVNGVLLKPFPFRDPGRLIVMREVQYEIRADQPSIPFNYRHFMRLRHDSKTIEDAFVFYQTGESVSTAGDHPSLIGAVGSSPNIFRVLGVQPILGRDFRDSDAVSGAPDVALLSYEGWQSLFEGRADVIGQTLRIGGTPTAIIGVLPAGLRFPQIALAPHIAFQEDAVTRNILLYEPFTPSERTRTVDVGNFNYKVIARLRRGVTLAQAGAELESLQRAYSQAAHLSIHLGIAVTPLNDDVASGVSGALWVLLAAVAGVLLIGCVNLANLQLARAAHAERETALRAALGASRGRLVWSRFAESLVLAAAGGAAGVALAFAGVRLLLALVPSSVPRLDEVAVSWPVLLVACSVSIAAAIAFGTLPALRSLKIPPQAALNANSGRTANTREGSRTRSLLVGAEVACMVVLLIVTSLALRSFSHLLGQNRGFDSSRVVAAQVSLLSPNYSDKRPDAKSSKLRFTDRALAALRALPGVESVAFTSVMPLSGQNWVDVLTRPDHPLPRAEQPLANVRWIDPDYVPTMRARLLAGRNIAASDRVDPHVALISERTAREAFPGEDPIGKKIGPSAPDDDHPVTVIGVLADARINGLKDDAAMVYEPYWAFTPWTMTFLVRSSTPGAPLMDEIRRAIWNIDPRIVIPSLEPLDRQLSDSVAADRFQAQVLGAFGASALLLALLGVYGVLAYSVSLRQREFGIRIALGSRKGALMGLVLREAASPVLLGACAGLALALAASRWVQSLLFETPAADPVAIGGSLLALFAIAALAAVVPARRAASVDPVQALRNE